MKNNILKFIGFFVMVAFLASCDKEAFEEYSSVPADAAPALTVTIDSFTDSTITVSYSMTGAGRVTLAVMPASVDAPDIASLEKRSIDDALYLEYFKHDDGSASGTVTYDGLDPFVSYIVYGIGHNLDGVASDLIASNTIKTLDFANPVLEGYKPAGSTTTRALSNQPIVLTFSEPVLYDETKPLHFFGYFYGLDVEIPADSISISGNVVTIKYGILPFNDYCFLEYAEGAFTDLSYNPCEEVVSGVIGGYLEGIWFRVETNPVTQIGVIFENFLGEYTCTDYLNDDSTTVDWGPYGVTVTENTVTDEPYDVLISGYWGYSKGTFVVTFNANFTITATYQNTGLILDNVFGAGNYGADEVVYSNIWSPDNYGTPIGHWNYSDFSFNFAVLFYNNIYGQIYDDLYQEYVKDDGSKVLKTDKPNRILKK